MSGNNFELIIFGWLDYLGADGYSQLYETPTLRELSLKGNGYISSDLKRLMINDYVIFSLLFCMYECRGQRGLILGDDKEDARRLRREEDLLAVERRHKRCSDSLMRIAAGEKLVAHMRSRCQGSAKTKIGRPRSEWRQWAFMAWWWLCYNFNLEHAKAARLLSPFFSRVWPRSSRGGTPYTTWKSLNADMVKIKKNLGV